MPVNRSQSLGMDPKEFDELRGEITAELDKLPPDQQGFRYDPNNIRNAFIMLRADKGKPDAQTGPGVCPECPRSQRRRRQLHQDAAAATGTAAVRPLTTTRSLGLSGWTLPKWS